MIGSALRDEARITQDAMRFCKQSHHWNYLLIDWNKFAVFNSFIQADLDKLTQKGITIRKYTLYILQICNKTSISGSITAEMNRISDQGPTLYVLFVYKCQLVLTCFSSSSLFSIQRTQHFLFHQIQSMYLSIDMSASVLFDVLCSFSLAHLAFCLTTLKKN